MANFIRPYKRPIQKMDWILLSYQVFIHSTSNYQESQQKLAVIVEKKWEIKSANSKSCPPKLHHKIIFRVLT